MQNTVWTRTFTSYTVWANIATLLAGILALPQFGELIPPYAIKWLALINAVLNLALRVFWTAEPITRMAHARAMRKRVIAAQRVEPFPPLRERRNTRFITEEDTVPVTVTYDTRRKRKRKNAPRKKKVVAQPQEPIVPAEPGEN